MLHVHIVAILLVCTRLVEEGVSQLRSACQVKALPCEDGVDRCEASSINAGPQHCSFLDPTL